MKFTMASGMFDVCFEHLQIGYSLSDNVSVCFHFAHHQPTVKLMRVINRLSMHKLMSLLFITTLPKCPELRRDGRGGGGGGEGSTYARSLITACTLHQIRC